MEFLHPVLLIFGAVLLFRLLYYFIRFSQLLLFKPKPEDLTSEAPGVSVIVCAHDEEENLKELIPLLLDQEYPNFECIIVNDRSNDDTYDLLYEWQNKDARVKMVNIDATPDHINGKKFAITLAVKAAKNEWLLHTDADCRPVSDQWIRSFSKYFKEGRDFVLGFSQYEKLPGILNQFIRFETLYTGMQYLSAAAAKRPYMGVGRNLAYRKSLFLENKGFHQWKGVTGGDDDLFVNQHAHKRNTLPNMEPEALVFSKPKTTWKSYFTQKKRHLSVGKLYKKRDRIQLGFVYFVHLLVWVSFFVGLCTNVKLYYLLGGLILNICIFGVYLWKSSKKTGSTFQLGLFPILDLFYVLYFSWTGIAALFSKRIKWK